jgi:hypothetical protein
MSGQLKNEDEEPKTRELGLCHRCEFRAQFIDEGHGPRCECGSGVHITLHHRLLKDFKKEIDDPKAIEVLEKLLDHGMYYEPIGSIHSCYQYRPTKPLVLNRSEAEERLWGNKRPIAGGIIGARLVGVKVAEGEYDAIADKDGMLPYFVPNEEEEE